MLDLIQKLVTLKKQAEQNVNAWEHAQIAYDRGASLPGLLRVYTGITDAPADDRADDAVLAVLGELKQTVYNASEVLKGAVAIAQGTVTQLDSLFEFLAAAESKPLKNLLEK